MKDQEKQDQTLLDRIAAYNDERKRRRRETAEETEAAAHARMMDDDDCWDTLGADAMIDDAAFL